ncbi:hypothetical protein ABT297_34725 [Dactylosporangium sp. NPDC000555]|uniref:hypothetical protein n=1 Tax=Dactylosporangium sp. NPDC000555 TaxID=3154260 RepID=UPI0033173021
MRDDHSTDPAGPRQPGQPDSAPRPSEAATPSQTPPPPPPRPPTPGGTPPPPPPPPAAPAAQEPALGGEPRIWDPAKADEFRQRWHQLQTHFVEDPPGSVTGARQLMDDAVQALAASVHDREEQLERVGARASDSTEGMRDTVLRYHELLDRLLSV